MAREGFTTKDTEGTKRGQIIVLVLSAAVIDSGAGARGFYHEGHRGHEEDGRKSGGRE
jgi:hypothetical protein